MLQCRQAGDELGDAGRARHRARAVAVAVDGEHDHRVELLPTVEDRRRSELRCTRRPDGAEARGGEERDDGLGDVGQQRHDPVAPADTETAQAGRAARDLVRELGVCEHAAFPGLRERHERDPFALAAGQCLLGVVEGGPAEPRRARHRRRGEHLARLLAPAHTGPLREQSPELGRFGDRPVEQLGERRELPRRAGRGEPCERGHLRGGERSRGRVPDDLAAVLVVCWIGHSPMVAHALPGHNAADTGCCRSPASGRR